MHFISFKLTIVLVSKEQKKKNPLTRKKSIYTDIINENDQNDFKFIFTDAFMTRKMRTCLIKKTDHQNRLLTH